MASATARSSAREELPTCGERPSSTTSSTGNPKDNSECCGSTAWLRARLPKGFHIEVAPPYVVTGDLGRHGVRYNLKRGVLRPARALHATYFRKRPTRPITILLFKSYRRYAHWARALFGLGKK